MSELRIGSLCSGYDGLAMGLQAVVGGEVVWQSENDQHASKILTTRYPGVPNLGDLTAINWPDVPSVDWLCAGFPCQDLSYAGRGAGIKEGTRSGLWLTIADAIGVLRPSYVLLENVSAIVNRRPGLDIVLADLARLGFDAQWTCLRASDVGAPHRRERWFLVATDASGGGRERRRADGLSGSRNAVAGSGDPASTHSESDGWDEGWAEPAGKPRRPDAAECGLSSTADPERRGRRGGARQPERRPVNGTTAPRRCESGCTVGIDWIVPGGIDYGPAVRRWHDLTRCVPIPAVIGPRGGYSLNPAFDEWMMGLPAGWVTDVDIPRNAQLKALGNGCVPQQVERAVRTLLESERVAA